MAKRLQNSGEFAAGLVGAVVNVLLLPLVFIVSLFELPRYLHHSKK
jgi:hypothetical protein